MTFHHLVIEKIKGLGEMAGADRFFRWLWIPIQGLCKPAFTRLRRKMNLMCPLSRVRFIRSSECTLSYKRNDFLVLITEPIDLRSEIPAHKG